MTSGMYSATVAASWVAVVVVMGVEVVVEVAAVVVVVVVGTRENLRVSR
jgi:hypothetical protein